MDPLLVKIEREPYSSSFTLIMPDGSSEDVEAEDAPEWFKLHHAGKMPTDIVERALDDAWNFYSAEVLITNPQVIKRNVNRTTPRI